VDPRADLNAVAKRKIPVPASNRAPGVQPLSLVIILTKPMKIAQVNTV